MQVRYITVSPNEGQSLALIVSGNVLLLQNRVLQSQRSCTGKTTLHSEDIAVITE